MKVNESFGLPFRSSVPTCMLYTLAGRLCLDDLPRSEIRESK